MLPLAEVQERVAEPEAFAPRLPSSRSVLLSIGLGILVVAAFFVQEVQAAIAVWDASTAYSHCYLVLPMAVYLIWERRAQITPMQARPELIWALLALPLTLLWLIAERLGVMEVRQLSVIALVEVLCLTLLGRRFYWLISGPLLFLFFLVPFGAFLTPALQQFTASFTTLGLDLLGTPYFVDKFTIETPAGTFFVAEACAGLRFLIAAIAFGVFYSLLNYTSRFRRVAFIAASVVVPVIANGFRALGIVVLGQVLGSAEAAAADHIIYGWVFFSVVMLLLIAGGHAFRDSLEIQAPLEAPRLPRLAASPGWCVALVLVLAGLGPAVATTIDSRLTPPKLLGASVIATPAGCVSTAMPDSSSSVRRVASVVCDGHSFTVTVQIFPARSTSSAMIAERRGITQEIGAENATVLPVDLPDGAGNWTVVQTSEPDRLTAYASWVDAIQFTSGLQQRFAQAHNSILGADYAPVLITITIAEPVRRTALQRQATMTALLSVLHAQAGLDERVVRIAAVNE